MPRSFAYRVLRSLLFDLVIPWLISAVLICVFFLMVVSFGLISWPIAFGIFLFVCVIRAKDREVEIAAQASAVEAGKALDSEHMPRNHPRLD